MEDPLKRLSDKQIALNKIANGIPVFPHTQGELDAIAESKIGKIDITPEQRANAPREFLQIIGGLCIAFAASVALVKCQDFINSGKPGINRNLAQNQPQLVAQTEKAKEALAQTSSNTQKNSFPIEVNAAQRYQLSSYFKWRNHIPEAQDRDIATAMIGDELAKRPINQGQQYSITDLRNGTVHAVETAPVLKKGDPVKMLMCTYTNARGITTLTWASTTHVNGEARTSMTDIHDSTLRSMQSCQAAIDAFAPRVLGRN